MHSRQITRHHKHSLDQVCDNLISVLVKGNILLTFLRQTDFLIKLKTELNANQFSSAPLFIAKRTDQFCLKINSIICLKYYIHTLFKLENVPSE